jgi:quercetin dioxygenase-like cupin family protein
VRAAGPETGGAYSVVELAGREGDMPPLHVHHDEDETFSVLEGKMTLFVGNDELELKAGECTVAPRGVPHVYRVDSTEARWLGVASPTFAEFVLAASVPAETETIPDAPPAFAPEELIGIAAQNGIEVLGPPGTLP